LNPKPGVIMRFLLIFMLMFFLTCSNSTGPDKNNNKNTIPDPFEQNILLKRSINLGNALEAPNEGDWGLTLQASYFEKIAAAGFTAVRVPIRWSAHTSANAPYTIDPFFMARILWVLEQSEKNNLATVINIHHFEEIFSEPAAQKEKFLSIWQQLAKKFVDRPRTVFYEILNEPHDNLTSALWNTYLAEAIQTIRAVDSTHTLIIGTAEWGGIAAMNKLIIPAEEKNAIFTFHYYEPFQFTHQGAEWVDNSEGWLGTQWLGSATEKLAIMNDFNNVKSWANNHNIPVFLGEFGAYSKADMTSRARWTDFISRTAESDSFSWAYWEFGSGFGAYDPFTDQWNNELLNALVP